MKPTILAPLLLLPLTVIRADDVVKRIKLDPTSPGRVFEGIGAVSAGASTRLLPDYPEPQRSQILDYLFKPKFGAGFQHLKVEIGGGENSTCGSEPSHAITREELADPVPRVYEFWFMAEARRRNPHIMLEGLPWSYPKWVGAPFTRDAADWFATFLTTARRHHDLELDWIAAAQNEMGTDTGWIGNHLRPALDAAGFDKVRLQAPDDNSHHWRIFDSLANDPGLDRLIGAVGYHYIDGRNPWQIDQKNNHCATDAAKRSGKPLWASEEWSQSGREWGNKGALYLARLINKLYTRDRTTKYLIWCPVDSIYDQIIWPDTGVMQADTPWCGHYSVWPSVWVVAHTTQFAEPGWVYMDDACGQLDDDTWRGSHVALRNPATGDWSVVVVTGDRRTVRIEVSPDLKSGAVHVWRSTAAEQFVHLDPVGIRNGTIELNLDADAVYTFTSTTGQQKGNFGLPPARAPFPLPFNEIFDACKDHDTPRFFSDQKGTFETEARPDAGMCLAQVVPEEGVLWLGNKLLKPHTLFGDTNWRDIAIEADVRITGGDVEIGGRYVDRDKLGYRWILDHRGTWSLNWQDHTLATGNIKSFDPNSWHHIRLILNDGTISGFVDGNRLASVTDRSGTQGMAFLASTYHRNRFDNIRVEACRASP